MAIYSKNGSKNINEVRAVALGTPGGTAITVNNEFAPSEAPFVQYAGMLNDKYKRGGATTWERPPASGA